MYKFIQLFPNMHSKTEFFVSPWIPFAAKYCSSRSASLHQFPPLSKSKGPFIRWYVTPFSSPVVMLINIHSKITTKTLQLHTWLSYLSL